MAIYSGVRCLNCETEMVIVANNGSTDYLCLACGWRDPVEIVQHLVEMGVEKEKRNA